MNKVLIGSTAIKYWFGDFKRDPKDKDYAVLNESLKTKGDDCMIIPIICRESSNEVANPSLLLTLKLSHIFFDDYGEIIWNKHMNDIQFLLSKGVTYDYDLMIELRGFWETHYRSLYRSDLTLNNKDFFDNKIKCDIEHDDIHKILKENPSYLKVLKEGCDVTPCPSKYSLLNNNDKDDLIIEEVMVMAYERFKSLNFRYAYFKMFNKYIRNHVPMFSFDYMIRNYIRLSRCPFNFIEYIDGNK